MNPLSHNTENATKNLRAAAEIETSSAWTVARLIAASVEPSQGKRDFDSQESKLTYSDAAKAMRRSKDTIRAYLTAWNAAAADGLCAPSSDLTPEDGWTATMPDAADWEKYKQANSHSTPRQTQTVPAEPIKAVEQWTPEQRQEVVRHLVTEDQDVASVAQEVVQQRPAPPVVSDEMKARIARGAEVREANEKSMTGVQKSLTLLGLDRALTEIKKVRRETAGTRFSGQEQRAISESIEDIRRALIEIEQDVHGVDWDAELAKLSGGEK